MIFEEQTGLRTTLSFWLNSLRDLFFPAHCLNCHQRLLLGKPPLLCEECLSQITFINSPQCTHCGRPFLKGVNRLCGKCLISPPIYDQARSLALYKNPLSDLLTSLKYHGNLNVLATIGHLYQTKFNPTIFLEKPDLIIPVPLHPTRLRERGYNQALFLATTCFPTQREKLQTNLLLRNKNTPPQTTLTGPQRRKNLVNVFSTNKPELIAGKQILLVDDVLTTGSTVNECAQVLRRAGASKIMVFTAARSIYL
ncbi:MAG: ComF family protein [Desulfobulbaceae bacterium]|nr:ComF family protein [Desulfobulbaceae bacterium]